MGDGLLDISQWPNLIKKHELMIIGVSDSECFSCCQSEGLLTDFQALNLKIKQKNIPIYRIDTSKPSSQAILAKEELAFDQVPRVLVYRDGRFYSYDSGFDRLDLMLHFVNRLLNPVVKLNTEEDILRFLGLQ